MVESRLRGKTCCSILTRKEPKTVGKGFCLGENGPTLEFDLKVGSVCVRGGGGTGMLRP